MNVEDELLAQLELAERIARTTCRRHRCSADAADEFASTVKLHLLDNDRSVLRRWQGESSLATYLTAVVINKFLDQRNREWGKWRPSAVARKLGPLAEQLERLVRRDGRTLEEAVAILQERSGDALPARELERIESRLPLRVRRVRVGDEPLAELPAPDSRPDRMLQDADRGRLREQVVEALRAALGDLSSEDRLIVKLRVLDDCPVVAIARMLGAEPKPLYRRIAAILKGLRDRLLEQGLDADALGELLTEEGLDPSREPFSK